MGVERFAKRIPHPERDARYQQARPIERQTEQDKRMPDWVHISQALGMSYVEWTNVPKEDQADVLEFFSNANAELLSNAKGPTVEMGTRFHDWWHIVDKAAASNGTFHATGELEAPTFTTIEDERVRYLSPDVVYDELYVAMFLSSGVEGYNLTKGIQDSKERFAMQNSIQREYNKLSKDMKAGKVGEVYRDILQLLLQPVADTMEGRMHDFEMYNKYVMVSQAAKRFPDVTDEEVVRIIDTFDNLSPENRPPHYARFAEQAFDPSVELDKDFFLKELLRVIRGSKEMEA